MEKPTNFYSSEFAAYVRVLLMIFFCLTIGFSTLKADTKTPYVQFFQLTAELQNTMNPVGAIVQDDEGNIYAASGGTATEGSVFKLSPDGTLTTLVNFSGYDGLYPGGLTKGIDGNIYGTTTGGGTNGWGTIFRIATNGSFSSIFSFSETNGSEPQAALVLGNDGDFYGTTFYGWGENFYNGTVFRFTRDGQFETLAAFNGKNGARPAGPLIQSDDGNFYGTASWGGDFNHGTIFRMSPSGQLTNLFSFSGTNGSHPLGGLVKASDDALYGTTAEGGEWGLGTVFRYDPNGTLSTLASFNGTNGACPEATLTQMADGYLYGTTLIRGSNNYGTIFRMTLDGNLTTIASLGVGSGVLPSGYLMRGQDGNLYGSAYQGTNGGAFFRLVNAPVITSIQISNCIPVLTWSAFPRATYDVEYTLDLSANSWISITNDLAAGSTALNVNFTESPDKCFFRIKLNPWQ